MKNFIKYFIAFIVLGLSTAYAQKSSIDSPHNYKRPVFQQRKAMQESKGGATFGQNSSDYSFKNNISSVHNYKRQGVNNFASESAFAINMPPKNEITFNALLSSNNYKAHFPTTTFGKQVTTNKKQNQTTMNTYKKDIDTTEAN